MLHETIRLADAASPSIKHLRSIEKRHMLMVKWRRLPTMRNAAGPPCFVEEARHLASRARPAGVGHFKGSACASMTHALAIDNRRGHFAATTAFLPAAPATRIALRHFRRRQANEIDIIGPCDRGSRLGLVSYGRMTSTLRRLRPPAIKSPSARSQDDIAMRMEISNA